MNGPSDTFRCPHCGAGIRITEAIQGQLAERIRGELRSRFDEERAGAEAAAERRAREALGVEMGDLRAALAEKSRRLEDAGAAELELRRRERALLDAQKDLELSVERKLAEQRTALQDQITRQVLDAHRLKEAENQKMVEDLRAQLEAAHRKAEQGSQQLQGEVLELDLEALLRENFPFDEILPVAKGVRGADVRQVVRTRTGMACGSILWESKRTKNWSDGWIGKLKEDQRAAKADVAAIVSEALPRDVSAFTLRDDVWVCNRACVLPVALALRGQLTMVAHARVADAHKDESLEALHRYMTGPEFRHRVEAIVRTFTALREDLDAEKRATTGRWAKREKQIELAVLSVAGMYGELKGHLGGSIQAIPSLEDGGPGGPGDQPAGADADREAPGSIP